MRRQLLALSLLVASVSLAEGAEKQAPSPQSARPAAKKPTADKPPAAPVPGALPLRPIPNPSQPPYRWEVPGLIDWVDAAGVQISDGVPLTLQMARSKRTVEELLQHFATSFEKAGLFIPPGHEQLRAFKEPQLTALDPERLVAYTVIFQPNPNKTVTVILGTSDLSAYDPAAQARPGWAPVPPGARQLLSTELEGAQTAVFEVPSTKEEVMAFYRDAMKRGGFVEQEPGEFRRGGEQILVFTESKDGKLSVGITRKRLAQGAP